MIDNKKIVKEYQTGDFEKRLNLFLECPSLRDKFIQIEQDQASRRAHLSIPINNERIRRKSVGRYCKRWVSKFTSVI